MLSLIEFKRKYHNWRLMKKQKSYRKEILDYLEGKETEKELKELIPFFQSHCFEALPYSWIDDVYYDEIMVRFDSQTGLYYTLWNGKKLYWKRNIKPKRIKKSVHALLMEQDKRSPHKYVFNGDMNQAVIADLGTAEGIFTLDIIDRVKHAYLFECDADWIEPLEATFLPWKDKVTIVNKMIGRCVDRQTTTLDDFFADKPVDFVKADIEGAEVDMLIGGEKTFRNKVQMMNICAYHRVSDEHDILQILYNYGFECLLTKGYMFIQQSDCKPSEWFRRGLVIGKRPVGVLQ